MSSSPECMECFDYIHSGKVLCEKCYRKKINAVYEWGEKWLGEEHEHAYVDLCKILDE